MTSRMSCASVLVRTQRCSPMAQVWVGLTTSTIIEGGCQRTPKRRTNKEFRDNALMTEKPCRLYRITAFTSFYPGCIDSYLGNLTMLKFVQYPFYTWDTFREILQRKKQVNIVLKFRQSNKSWKYSRHNFKDIVTSENVRLAACGRVLRLVLVHDSSGGGVARYAAPPLFAVSLFYTASIIIW